MKRTSHVKLFQKYKWIDDDLYDSTNLEKKEGLEPVINNVAESKFQLFREKKKTDM